MVAIAIKRERRERSVFRAGTRRRIQWNRPKPSRSLSQRISAVSLDQRIQRDRTYQFSRHGINAVEDESGFRQLGMDPYSLIVAIDGACQRNGLDNAWTGYGVFFSSGQERLNANGRVPTASPQTSQYAELYATMRALDMIHQLMIAGRDFSHVIIKTDSEYLSKGLYGSGIPMVIGTGGVSPWLMGVRSSICMKEWNCWKRNIKSLWAFAW